MSKHLDMPLDQIIEINKQKRGGWRGRGRRGGAFSGNRGARTGGFLRVRRQSASQVAKSFISRLPDAGWRRDLFGDALGSALGIETSTKLFISNLDYGVSNEDIKELFLEMGNLKHCGIHYDRSGRSIGTADVVFIRRQDAIAAMKRYNNVLLDGKPLKIELIGRNLLPPVPRATNRAAFGRGGPSAAKSGARRGRGIGFRRFQGRGRGWGRRPPFTEQRKQELASELDADLEKYHKDAMQIS